MQPAATITRRTVLAGSLLAVAGCHHAAPRSKPPTVSPDATALDQARMTERQLIAAYSRTMALGIDANTTAALDAAREAHVAHLAALGGTPTAPTATPSPGSTIGAAVTSLLRASATSLRASAVAAVDGSNAATFASIAASHKVMLGD